MSLSVEGQKCPVCQSYLFDDDDIVYCPICGAPHHRDCYAAVGHCMYEDKHGTSEQYDASAYRKEDEPAEEPHPETQTEQQNAEHCHVCGRPIAPDANFCSYCRAPRDFVRPDPMGGIKADSQVEGVTAQELARFTAVNPVRYVKKFFSLNKQNKISWNWAAFLIPCEWAIYRKCYKSGIMFGLLALAGTLLSMPLQQAIQPFIADGMNYNEITMAIVDNMDKIGMLPVILTLVGGAINIIVRVVSGVFGDYIYRQNTLSRIKEIKQSGAEQDLAFRQKGGVSIFWFMVAYMVNYYLPYILISLL